jgi:small subunit ribosomal protein S9
MSKFACHSKPKAQSSKPITKKMEVTNTLGRRKTAVARIYMKPGKGDITVNGRDVKEYFPSEILQIVVNQPFALLKTVGSYDLKVNVDGGGIKGQAEAIRLAISRALCEVNLENRPALKKEGFLTRDPRMVERKKPGRRKARRKFQFSKR